MIEKESEGRWMYRGQWANSVSVSGYVTQVRSKVKTLSVETDVLLFVNSSHPLFLM